MKARRWRNGALLGLVLVVALVAAGCGEKSDTGGGSTGTTAAAAPAVDEALAAKVPDAIKSDGKIVIGTDSSYPPNEFLDTDGKTVVGFDVDLFNAVAAKLGLKTEWQSAVVRRDHPGCRVRQVRGRRLVVHHQRERKKQVNMVSYFNAGTQWATKKGNPNGVQPDDACGKKIAVQTDTVQDPTTSPQAPGEVHRARASRPSLSTSTSGRTSDGRGGHRQGRRHAGRLSGDRLRGQADQRPARAAR